MQIVEIDGQTGAITQRDATAEEIATHEAETKFYADLRIAEENKLLAKTQALESAKAKLVALGLTTEEAAALLG